MDKANNLPLSTEVLATALNISSSEFSTLFEEKDGVMTPKDEKTINTFVLAKLGDRIESVVSEKTSGIESQAESKWKRLAFKEIEDKAKDEFGVSMNWSQDGFSKIKEATSKGKKQEPVDVERSEPFLNMVKEYEERLKNKDQEYSTELQNLKRNTVVSSLENDLFQYFKSKDKELSIPHNEAVLKNQIKIMIERDLFKEDSRPEYKDGQLVLVDKDGNIVQDKANGYQPIDVLNYATDIAKQGYFPELQTPKISSPNPAAANSNSVEFKDKTFTIPKFNDIEELSKFTRDAQTSYAPEEAALIINEANKQAPELLK